MTVEEETKVIDAGKRIEAFLADEIVVAAMDRLKAEYFNEFMAAKTPDELVLVKNKVQVLADLGGELRRAVDAGKYASITRGRREKSSQTRGKMDR